jgi:hypothetical protein
MKKRNAPTDTKAQNARRLKLKKEVLRNLSPADLGIVAGGIGCTRSVPPPGGPSNCC